MTQGVNTIRWTTESYINSDSTTCVIVVEDLEVYVERTDRLKRSFLEDVLIPEVVLIEKIIYDAATIAELKSEVESLVPSYSKDL